MRPSLVHLSLILLCCVGCGTNPGTIQGTVLLDDQPLAGVVVCLSPATDHALHSLISPATADDGSFLITPDRSLGEGGAGDYHVTISCEKDQQLALTMAGRAPQEIIQAALGRPMIPCLYWYDDSTPLRATVTEGITQLEPLRLDSRHGLTIQRKRR